MSSEYSPKEDRSDNRFMKRFTILLVVAALLTGATVFAFGNANGNGNQANYPEGYVVENDIGEYTLSYLPADDLNDVPLAFEEEDEDDANDLDEDYDDEEELEYEEPEDVVLVQAASTDIAFVQIADTEDTAADLLDSPISRVIHHYIDGDFYVEPGEIASVAQGGFVDGNVTVAPGGTLYLYDGGVIRGIVIVDPSYDELFPARFIKIGGQVLSLEEDTLEDLETIEDPQDYMPDLSDLEDNDLTAEAFELVNLLSAFDNYLIVPDTELLEDEYDYYEAAEDFTEAVEDYYEESDDLPEDTADNYEESEDYFEEIVDYDDYEESDVYPETLGTDIDEDYIDGIVEITTEDPADQPLIYQDIIRVSVGSNVIYRSHGDSWIETPMDTTAFMSDEGSVMVPVRFLNYALGHDVQWDAENSLATISSETTTVSITPGETAMTVNGVDTTITDSLGNAVSAYLENDRIFLPMNALGDAFDLEYRWSYEDQEVTFYPNGQLH